MKGSLKLKLRKLKMNSKMSSLRYTIIDSENNVIEAEFDDEYKVLFKKKKLMIVMTQINKKFGKL